jgi:hypothetical protein
MKERELLYYEKQVELLNNAKDCLITWTKLMNHSRPLELLVGMSSNTKHVLANASRLYRYARNVLCEVYVRAIVGMYEIPASDKKALRTLVRGILSETYK